MINIVDINAAKILAEAYSLNDLPETFTRSSSAWDPYNKKLVAENTRRRKSVYWGGGVFKNADLIERTTENLCLQSQNFNTTWSKTDISISGSNTLAPDNTITADLITEGTANTAYVRQLVTISASSIYTWSIYAKLAPSSTTSWVRLVMGETTTNFIQAWFDLSTGTKGNTTTTGSGWSGPTSNIETVGGGWYRISLTGTSSTNTTAQFFLASTTGNGVSARQANATYYLWGAQGESLGWPSTYIPTTTAAATRNADDLTADLSGLPGGGLRRDEGSILIITNFIRDVNASGLPARVFSGGSTSTMRGAFSGTTQAFIQRDSGGDQVGSISGSSPLVGSNNQFVGIYSTDRVEMWRGGIRGSSVDSATTSPFDARTTLNIGRLASTEYSDALISMLYIPRALTPAEIATLAKAGGLYGI
jgi:hypothetical protein